MDLHFNPKSDLYTTYSDKIPTKIVNDLEKSEISVDSTRTPCQGKRNDEPRLCELVWVCMGAGVYCVHGCACVGVYCVCV